MLAQVGDTLARYEDQRFHCQKMIAFRRTIRPATNPFDYPDLMKKMFEKFASVNMNTLRSSLPFRPDNSLPIMFIPTFPILRLGVIKALKSATPWISAPKG